MDFAFSPEHEQIRATVRRFSNTVLAPLVEAAEESETFPRQLWRQWAGLGLLGFSARRRKNVESTGFNIQAT